MPAGPAGPAAHPRVAAALGAAQVSVSWARIICDWTDRLPEECREDADEILLGAARTGLDLRDLAALAAEMYEKPGRSPRGRPGPGVEDRSVRLETTFGGAGVSHGDLTPECAAVMTTVLDALSAPAGAEDTRSHDQRYHDALEEAMRRLVAGGLLPERAGQPVKVRAHISPGRPDRPGRGFGAAGGVDRAGPGPVGRGPRRRLGRRRRRRRVAGRRRRGGVRVRRLDDPGGHRRQSTPRVLEDLVRLCVELAGHGPGRAPRPATDPGTGADRHRHHAGRPGPPADGRR